MHKKYTVFVSVRANELLVNLAKVSRTAAEKLYKDFEYAAESLKTMPGRCPLIDLPFVSDNNYRSLLFGNRYEIIYEIKNDTVYIDYILDCRQDYSWLID